MQCITTFTIKSIMHLVSWDVAILTTPLLYLGVDPVGTDLNKTHACMDVG